MQSSEPILYSLHFLPTFSQLSLWALGNQTGAPWPVTVPCLQGPRVGQFSSIVCLSRWLLATAFWGIQSDKMESLCTSYSSIGIIIVLPILRAGFEECEYCRLLMRLELPVSCLLPGLYFGRGFFFCFYIYFKYILRDIYLFILFKWTSVLFACIYVDHMSA